jgi:DNA-directed RNA polymerase subunit RPC12/RpoP
VIPMPQRGFTSNGMALCAGCRKQSGMPLMSKERLYVCPSCGRRVVLYVKPSALPVCSNPKKHTTRRVEMRETK